MKKSELKQIIKEEIQKVLDRTLKLPKDIKDPNSRTATVSVKGKKEKLTDEQKKNIKEVKERLKKQQEEEEQEEEDDEKEN